MQPRESWASVGPDELAFRLRQQTDCDHPEADATSGLVAFLGAEPVGWCAVEPRAEYPRLLRNNRVPWEHRNEDKADGSVWAVTCFVTRTGFRKRGSASALTQLSINASDSSRLTLIGGGGPAGCVGYNLENAEGAAARGLWLPLGIYGVYHVALPQNSSAP